MFTLLVRFDLPDDAAATAFDALVADAVPLIRRREPGTLTYLPYGVEGRPLVRVFYEVYRDAEAHADHERQPHTVEFLTAIRQLVSDINVDRLTDADPA
jgi:quinol monooxygenase YgiN